jgi:hypothetical protein
MSADSSAEWGQARRRRRRRAVRRSDLLAPRTDRTPLVPPAVGRAAGRARPGHAPVPGHGGRDGCRPVEGAVDQPRSSHSRSAVASMVAVQSPRSAWRRSPSGPASSCWPRVRPPAGSRHPGRPVRDWPVALATGGCERRPAPTTLGGPPAPCRHRSAAAGFWTIDGLSTGLSPAPMRGMAMLGEHHGRPAARRARRRGRGHRHPPLPRRHPGPGTGRPSAAHRRDAPALQGSGHRSVAGVQLATLQALSRYWATEHDWHRCGAKAERAAAVHDRDRQRSRHQPGMATPRSVRWRRPWDDTSPGPSWVDVRWIRRRAVSW